MFNKDGFSMSLSNQKENVLDNNRMSIVVIYITFTKDFNISHVWDF